MPANSPSPDEDKRYMGLAIGMARRGLGATAPNPSVGAVVVSGAGDSGIVLARATTASGGRPHAETQALARAGKAAQGSTVYVTLEPCAHTGKTPPCADALIAAGVARVVVGASDPDIRVAGQGIERLRATGIEVVEGVETAEAHWVTLGHILRVSEARPFVQLKLAVSSDGKIAAGDGSPVWVTGPQARARGHLLRAQADAIMVGRGTIAADDPSLTCRLPGLEARSPLRVVLDTTLASSPGATCLQRTNASDPGALLFAAGDAPLSRAEALQTAGAAIVRVARDDDGGMMRPLAILRSLATRGITRVMIEGGPRVASSFVAADLVDEVQLFIGKGTLGDSGIRALYNSGIETITDSIDWRLVHQSAIGKDTVQIYRRRASEFAG